MKTKLWLFFIAFGLIFSACEKDDEFRGGPPAHSNAGGKKSNNESPALTGNGNIASCDFTDASITVDLIAGQHYVVGEVEVSFDVDFMYVAYSTDGTWYITETHLHVGSSPDDFPLVGPGNPQIGLFNFNGYYEVDDDITKFAIPIELLPSIEECCYYIAAHAVVSNGEYDLESISEILLENNEVKVFIPKAPQAGSETYFQNITLTEGPDFLNGNYNGWCLQPEETYNNGIHYAHSSIAGGSGYDQVFLNKVNWIINQKFSSQSGYTYGDVQVAIWMLKLGYNTFDEAIADDPDFFNDPPYPGFNQQYLNEYSQANVEFIVAQANINGADFYPECGDVFAIILTRSSQDIFIEFPVPCDETAWGDGVRFTQRGNWAMYFSICAN